LPQDRSSRGGPISQYPLSAPETDSAEGHTPNTWGEDFSIIPLVPFSIILDTVLAQAPKARVLHLATHAYFAGEDCTPAGLISEQRRPGGEPPAFLGYNPLLLAGIAFTGANDRDKADGILTALEVTALDLRGTDLVVLSACDTGLGTTARGQELLGLRWAFAYAGARNLVTSLWSVPDAETATLMTHFYTALWEKGLSVPAALRAAQLEMLKAARARGDSAPHTWGAFAASGSPQ
jgi:CHAT domain-containing protein